MSITNAAALSRVIFLTRDSDHFRLSFPRDERLNARVRELPFAVWDQASQSWVVPICTQVLHALRTMHNEGLTDVAADDLLMRGEKAPTIALAVLRQGTASRPWRIQMGVRDDHLYSRLRTVPGSAWDKGSKSLTFPPNAAAAIGELIDRQIVADPDGILDSADVNIAFDARTGNFSVRGDARAQEAFDTYFPRRDVVAAWRDKGIDVAFTDEVSEELYRGELARTSDGLRPDGIVIDLFDYQAHNVALAVERSGLGIFDEPGLGKTASAIGTGHELAANRREVPRVIVVCPASLRTQWAREIDRFTGGHTGGVAVAGGDAKQRRAAYDQAADSRWLVVHWDVLSRDLDKIEPLARGALIVFDEAHRAKSYQSKRSKAANRLAKLAARRVALTGTPVVNRPDEWFAVLNLCVPGCLGAPLEFLDRYMYQGRFGGYEGAKNLPELRRRSVPFFIRHTKREVASHLPPLLVEHQPLDVTPRYAALLKRAHRSARDEIRDAAIARASNRGGARALDGYDNEEIATAAEMTAVGMLRLLCSSPRLLLSSDSAAAEVLIDAGLVPDEDGPKVDWLRARAAEWQQAGERAVVFTFSKRMARLISERFTEDGIRHVTYTGSTSRAERDLAVEEFTSQGDDQDPGPTCFVATDAAAEGLNLGRHCSLLVNVDVPWQPGVLEQRSNRIHRVDGTHPNYLVTNLTIAGTMEEGLVKMISRKADLADSLLGEHTGRGRTIGRRQRQIPVDDFSAIIEEYVDDRDAPLPEVPPADPEADTDTVDDTATAEQPGTPEPLQLFDPD